MTAHLTTRDVIGQAKILVGIILPIVLILDSPLSPQGVVALLPSNPTSPEKMQGLYPILRLLPQHWAFGLECLSHSWVFLSIFRRTHLHNLSEFVGEVPNGHKSR